VAEAGGGSRAIRRRWGAARREVPGRWGRPAPAVAVLLAALSAATLLLPSVASAPTGSSVYSAPYGTATVVSATHHTASGCTHLSLADSRWNASTGLGGFSARATSTSCAANATGAVNTSSVAVNAMSTVTLTIARPAGAKGAMSVVVNVSVNGTALDRTTIRWNCPAASRVGVTGYAFVLSACNANSAARFTLGVELEDLTSHMVVAYGSRNLGYTESGIGYSDDYCYAYGCYWSNYSYQFSSGNLTQRQSFVVTINPNPSDVYAVVLVAQTAVATTVNGFGGTTVTQSLNVGTQGSGWSLDRVTVT